MKSAETDPLSDAHGIPAVIRNVKRTKILFVHQTGRRGGAGTMLANIVRGIDKRRFEPIVICPPGDVGAQLVAAGADVRPVPRSLFQFLHYTGYTRNAWHPSFLLHAYGMWRDASFWEEYFRDSGASIVFINSMTLAPMARAARAAGAKVVCLYQETAVRGLLGLRTAWLHHELSSHLDAVLFISEYDRDRARCRAPIVEVIPNWVDLSEFDSNYPSARARAALRVPSNAQVILMMGGISELKGTLPLLQAVRRLANIDNLLVLVAGYNEPIDLVEYSWLRRRIIWLRRKLTTDYHEKVLRFIKRNALTDRVRFVGMQNDVVILYAAADVVVFPATMPHQARPVLEAGAMAKPVVVPGFAQTEEFVKHGRNGLTYTPNDSRSLAVALEMVLGSKEMAQDLGKANYHVTCTNHDGVANARRVNAVLDRLADSIDE